MVAVAQRADRAELRPDQGADHRHVLVRDEGEDGAREFRRRAGRDHDPVAAFAVVAQHVQRDRQQPRPDRIGMRGDVTVDQRVQVAAPMQADGADPHERRDAGAARGQERDHWPATGAASSASACRHHARSISQRNRWLPESPS